ncbi:hypothetical protein MRB53_038891 [Persea americana]|nr:hypothetical protein MRB53_038891 [Persea americana]
MLARLQHQAKGRRFMAHITLRKYSSLNMDSTECIEGYVHDYDEASGHNIRAYGYIQYLEGIEPVLRHSAEHRDEFWEWSCRGIVTTYATQPIDTVKTRAQSAKGAGTVEAFKGVIEDYGVRGLWRGSTMRLGRTVFAGGILFTAYEQVVAVLLPIMGRKDIDKDGNSIT